MRKQLLWGLCLMLLFGCNPLPAQEAPQIIEILPTAPQLATPNRKPLPGLPSDRLNPLASDQAIALANWQIKIRSVLRGDQAAQLVRETNQFNDLAQTGYQYLIVEFSIKPNTSLQNAQHPLIRLTGDYLKLYSQTSVVLPMPYYSDMLFTSETLAQVAFHIPADETNLVLVLSDDYNEQPVFVAIDPQASIQPDPNVYLVPRNTLGIQSSEPALLGETIVTNDWELTVLEYVRGDRAWQMLQQANMYNEPAAPNAEYILFKLRVRSLDHHDLDTPNITTILSFAVLSQSQTELKQPSLVLPDPKLNESLYAGGQTEGWRAYMIPKDEQNLQIIFNSNIFSISNADTRYIALE